VLGLSRPLERHGRAGEAAEGVREPCDRVVGGQALHAPIVGGARYRFFSADGAAVIGITTPSRWSASCTSSRAL
jgi:hypothetical protein